MVIIKHSTKIRYDLMIIHIEITKFVDYNAGTDLLRREACSKVEALV
jgi:hypothetical protein